MIVLKIVLKMVLRMVLKIVLKVVLKIVLKIVYVGVENGVCWCFDEASEYKGWVIKLDLTTPVKF